MSKHILGKSNQKLYFASIHLREITSLQASNTLDNKRAIIQAHAEAAVINLLWAYRSFIWEVCQTYQLAVQPDMCLADVQQAASEQGKQVQALNFFAQLEQNPSWLKDLLAAYAQIVALDPDAKPLDKETDGLISVQQVADTLSAEKISLWHKALNSEIETLRATLVEW